MPFISSTNKQLISTKKSHEIHAYMFALDILHMRKFTQTKLSLLKLSIAADFAEAFIASPSCYVKIDVENNEQQK